MGDDYEYNGGDSPVRPEATEDSQESVAGETYGGGAAEGDGTATCTTTWIVLLTIAALLIATGSTIGVIYLVRPELLGLSWPAKTTQTATPSVVDPTATSIAVEPTARDNYDRAPWLDPENEQRLHRLNVDRARMADRSDLLLSHWERLNGNRRHRVADDWLDHHEVELRQAFEQVDREVDEVDTVIRALRTMPRWLQGQAAKDQLDRARMEYLLPRLARLPARHYDNRRRRQDGRDELDAELREIMERMDRKYDADDDQSIGDYLLMEFQKALADLYLEQEHE